jgi:transcription initiation factor IIE alpha subunit
MQIILTEPSVKRLIELLEKTGSTYDQAIANKLKKVLQTSHPITNSLDIDDIPF